MKYSCYCFSVTQSCLTVCDPMDCSTPGLPTPHHLLEFAQVHVYCISDAVQPSHPPFPDALIFRWSRIHLPHPAPSFCLVLSHSLI